MHQESGCKIKAACSIEIQDGQTSSMSEYKNQWVLDLVTQGNHWQNTNFRNNAVIFASLDLQFWFGPVLFFYLSFSCHMKCLALYSVFQAMKHSSEEFIPPQQQALWAQSLAGSGYLRFLWNTSYTMSHFTLWCWPAPGLEGTPGRQAGWPAEHGHSWRQSPSALLRQIGSWGKGTGKCLQSACPAPKHFV